MNKAIIFLFSVLIFLVSCGGEQGDCRYGKPQAILNDSIPSAQNHQFELKGNNSIESIEFPQMGVRLEVFQSGCNEITQEFRFHLADEDGEFPKDTPAAQTALIIAGLFQHISQLHPSLFQLGSWAEAIGQTAPNFEYNEPTKLKGNPFIAQLDKTHGSQEVIVSLVLNSEE